jgi:hypothetical protein
MKPLPQTLTAEYVRSILDYDHETGILTRKLGFARHIGKPAGYLHKSSGYYMLKVGSKPHFVHRIAWVHYYGEWPNFFFVDHINGDKTDNRICNLRKATHGQNAANSKPRSACGIKGVYPAPRMPGRWQACIALNGKTTNLGIYESLEEADSAYRRAAIKKYGQYARFE